MLFEQSVVRLRKTDEVDRHEPRSLMQQLVERVLAVGAWLAPHDWSRGRRDVATVEAHALTVALHIELLQVSGEAAQLVRVRQHCLRLGAEHVVIPDTKKCHDDWCVGRWRCRPKVFVDCVEPGEELAKRVGTDRDH